MVLEKEQSYTPLPEDEDAESTQGYEHRPRQWWRYGVFALAVYAGLVTVVLAYIGAQSLRLRAPWSPVDAVIKYETRKAVPDPHSILSSEPSYEMEREWTKLLYPAYIYATEDEIRRQGDDPHTSVRLAEGNYLGVLGVYHQLHCLRWLYFLAHEEVYWTNMTDAARDFRRGHGRHCIQILTDYVKCKPDISVYSIQFNATRDTIPKFKAGPSWQCVNWDGIHTWAMDRAQGYDPPLLAPDAHFDVHPQVDNEEAAW